MMNRKEQIVAVASDLLRTRGYTDFSYQDLAKTLGIAKASIHHHFPKKDDLGMALCQWSEDWLAQAFLSVEAAHDHAWDRLEAYLQGSLYWVTQENKVCPLCAFHHDLYLLPPAMQAAVKALDAFEIEWVHRIFSEGKARQELHFQGDALASAYLFICTAKGALYFAQSQGPEAFHCSITQLKRLAMGPTDLSRSPRNPSI